MGRIVILDENTASQIAAGEVVERPASVVKELIENSLDAGADRITVEIRNGGISYIRVTDNGSGIEEDDVEIAFERHSTSKIRSGKDLESIHTLGFRGEALASIASVSNVELTTRTADSPVGTLLRISGGTIHEKSSIGCPPGTTFVVRDLFFNTPARYKFLKKDSTEAGYVTDLVTRMILGNPAVSFQLIVNNRTTLKSPGNGDLKSAIFSVFGKDIVKLLTEVNQNEEGMSIYGYVGKPALSRSNRNHQIVFMNGRLIRSKVITSALDEAYKTLLMTGKYAFAVLNLTINPVLVDVNVHPAKTEVRFSDEQSVFRLVYHSVRNALTSDNLIPNGGSISDRMTFMRPGFSSRETPFIQMSLPENEPGEVSSRGTAYDRRQSGNKVIAEYGNKTVEREISPVKSAGKAGRKDNVPVNHSELKEQVAKFFEAFPPVVEAPSAKSTSCLFTDGQESGKLLEENELQHNISQTDRQMLPQDVKQQPTLQQSMTQQPMAQQPTARQPITQPSIDQESISRQAMAQQTMEQQSGQPLLQQPMSYKRNNTDSKPQNEKFSFSSLQVIGQAFDTFIFLQGRGEIYIIDQHAAHERIQYERLRQNFNSQNKSVQYLLEPVVIELSATEMETVKEYESFLKGIGFELDSYGLNTLALRGIPFGYRISDAKDLFIIALSSLHETDKEALLNRLDESLYSLACKSAVKANKRLHPTEINELLLELDRLENPFTCPHGRPVAIRMTRYELEKKFKRIV